VPLPEKKADLEAMGYLLDNEGKCRGCAANIECWISPTGKKLPMSVIPLDAQGQKIIGASLTAVHEYVRRSHFSDCPSAAEFRKKNDRPPAW
jgi:hypothetical protein